MQWQLYSSGSDVEFYTMRSWYTFSSSWLFWLMLTITCLMSLPLLQLSQTDLAASGRSFSSGGQTGNTSISNLGVGETAAAFLPASLFQSTTGRDSISVGIFFAVYDTGVLFPITNSTEINQETNASTTTIVGSPVIAATVGSGLNFDGLAEPVTILLRLNQLGVSDRIVL